MFDRRSVLMETFLIIFLGKSSYDILRSSYAYYQRREECEKHFPPLRWYGMRAAIMCSYFNRPLRSANKRPFTLCDETMRYDSQVTFNNSLGCFKSSNKIRRWGDFVVKGPST